MDGIRVERVVDLELEHRLGSAVVNEGADKAGEKRGPHVHRRATGGDGDEAGEDAVADHAHVVRLGENAVEEDDGDAAHGGGEGGAHGGARHDGAVPGGGDAEGGARVEAVPAHPEDESTDDLERSRLARDRHHLAALVEPPRPRPNHKRAAERRHAARHVDHARAREIDAAASPGFVLIPGEATREEATITPHPVHDDGVDEARDDGRVDEVGDELRPLSDSARDDGGSGGSKDVLEKPEGHRVAVVFSPRLLPVPPFPAGGREWTAIVGSGADELVSVVVISAVSIGDAHAPQPPDDGTKAGVKKILEQDVLGVLGAHRSRLEQREAALHEEDKHAAHEEVEGVQRLRICPQRGRL
mmetsp:Transcript_6906/g.19717  ORF Transcript_6906/g.19717 Transcript_6906/m.19717 type:complete len:358 (+) Transcript_6906:986-2059(+)